MKLALGAVTVTVLALGCGSSDDWTPEQKSEAMSLCVETPAYMGSDGPMAELSQVAEDFGLTTEEVYEQAVEIFRSNPGYCECVVSFYEKKVTLEELERLEFGALQDLTAKASKACL